mmetsp:Transcript_58145/g.123481  ORF Transcript_58145/g.123481 Transcript_58145/m.123481 type:complete len:406 (-) Transcript_58145:154-1371(-)|eukprot:CAMPEP_0206439196 /NCGR_PEP_ID=MMETSP0324_2-20121206/12067_1 /ASSEMBLY_ACC=CAM_ASM_000836 /TAXON_ID=2866 /ORGANISM="Crypthecodinium cohnii, Strain Seligo" /LENGTH=405 /DNA_ID=CAMNT_0053906771 /DNA_START=785 /DNA_END=2002 /DNA_ORIENTATION=+
MVRQWLWVTKWIALGGGVFFLGKVFSRSIVGLRSETWPLSEWVEQYEEDAIEPDLDIVDAHHFLWDPRIHNKGWPLPRWALRFIYGLKPYFVTFVLSSDRPLAYTCGPRAPVVTPYMAADFLADIEGNGKGHSVVGSIYIESGWQTPNVDLVWQPAGEVDMVSEERRKNLPLLKGVIAFVDLRLGVEIEPVLKRYSQNSLVKGIRHNLAFSSDPMVLDGTHTSRDTAFKTSFRAGFALLHKYGFSYDCWLYHDQVEALADLARCFPETTIIANHIATPLAIAPHRASDSVPKWKTSMKKLAKNKNVFVKIGGLGMRTFGFEFDERPMPPSSDELAEAWGPLVLFVVETFGVDRCMMESNFPFDKVTCSYTVLFNALKKIVRDHPVEDKRKMFELNAKRIYRIRDA